MTHVWAHLSPGIYQLQLFWEGKSPKTQRLVLIKTLFIRKVGLLELPFIIRKSTNSLLALNKIELYLCRKIHAMQFELRPALFWDVDVERVDLFKHRASVIERVATRGRLEEFRAMVKFYGKETVKSTLLNARHLDKRTLSYCSLIFDVPVTEFRCYKLAQLNPEHWNY